MAANNPHMLMATLSWKFERMATQQRLLPQSFTNRSSKHLKMMIFDGEVIGYVALQGQSHAIKI